jgi:single-strand DNA-binding protein
MNYSAKIGRLTRDPEYGNSGNTTYLRFDIAVNRPENDETDFVRCILWNKLADSMQRYLRKGRLIFIAGRDLSSKYVKDGVTRKEWTLHGQTIELLDRYSDSASEPENDNNQGPWS